jgi:hypothetical protein
MIENEAAQYLSERDNIRSIVHHPTYLKKGFMRKALHLAAEKIPKNEYCPRG